MVKQTAPGKGGRRFESASTALSDRIKHQTTYRVQFDNVKRLQNCIAGLKNAPPTPKARLQWRKADIAIGKAGVLTTETAGAATVVLDETEIELPDLLTDLQARTQLTRRSIISILIGSGRRDDFKRNSQQFIEQTAEIIKRCKRLALADGIKYQKIGDEHFYAQELFAKDALTGSCATYCWARRGPSTSTSFTTRTPSATSPTRWRRTWAWCCMPSCRAGSRCPRR